MRLMELKMTLSSNNPKLKPNSKAVGNEDDLCSEISNNFAAEMSIRNEY